MFATEEQPTKIAKKDVDQCDDDNDVFFHSQLDETIKQSQEEQVQKKSNATQEMSSINLKESTPNISKQNSSDDLFDTLAEDKTLNCKHENVKD